MAKGEAEVKVLRIGLVVLVLMAVLVVTVLAQGQVGTVTARRLNVRAGPGTTYRIVNSLPRGCVVTIYETRYGWYRIGPGRWVSGVYVAIGGTQRPATVASPVASRATVAPAVGRYAQLRGATGRYNPNPQYVHHGEVDRPLYWAAGTWAKITAYDRTHGTWRLQRVGCQCSWYWCNPDCIRWFSGSAFDTYTSVW